MVVLGRREGPRVEDFRDDRLFPAATELRLLFRLLGQLTLLRGGYEDRGAVLSAAVVALLIFGGRVVHLEEPLIEQLFERDALRIEHDSKGFRVARAAGLDLLVG